MGRRRRQGRLRRALGDKGSRRRVWIAAAGFGALAVVLALVGVLGDDPTWLRTAVLTGVLAVVWAAWALVVRP
jgi:Flp pilus assembly protein TadB